MTAFLLTLAMTVAPPAWAWQTSPSASDGRQEEAIQTRVKQAGARLGDAAFQRLLKGLNVQHRGHWLRRSGWVVATHIHPAPAELVTVHVSNRHDRPGVTWTAYMREGYGLAPGDHLEWEGRIRRIDPTGDVRLERERIVQWTPNQRSRYLDFSDPMNWRGYPQPVSWITRGLAARPLLRQVEAVVPPDALQDYVAREAFVRLWVSPAGHVSRAAIVQSSGRMDVDRAVLEAVGAWRFAPWPHGGPGYDQVDDVWVPIQTR